jgi:hypothetical protein
VIVGTQRLMFARRDGEPARIVGRKATEVYADACVEPRHRCGLEETFIGNLG